MARRPELEAVLTKQGWMVSIPPSLSVDGKRERKFFGASKSKAEKFAQNLRKRYHDGERGVLLRPDQSIQAAEAIKILTPLGITLIEAARQAVERANLDGSPETLRDRWLAYMGANESGWRQRYIDDIKRIPRWLGDEVMGRRVCDVDESVLLSALVAGGAVAKSTQKMRMDRVKAMLSGKSRVRKGKRVALMTKEHLALLKWKARRDVDARRVVGLLLFAGIRPDPESGEISRLDWSAIGAEEIYISEDVSKTGTDRHIPLTRRLKWWLRRHPASGPVAPSGWKKRWQKLRGAAHLGRSQDLTRHAFASHYLAVWGEHPTKQAMGHTADSDTLFRHYRRAVTEKRGRIYFGLPAKVDVV